MARVFSGPESKDSDGTSRFFFDLGFLFDQSGIYDDVTLSAAHAYQRSRGLIPPPGMEGIVGQTSLDHLRRDAQMILAAFV